MEFLLYLVPCRAVLGPTSTEGTEVRPAWSGREERQTAREQSLLCAQDSGRGVYQVWGWGAGQARR